MGTSKVLITECPRDAMQGLQEFVPTALKIEYLNELLKVGFDRLDFGSFVSPKAIPQMRDTSEVLDRLHVNPQTQLIAIIANQRGSETACQFEQISFLGYPFSISETFQRRNTNSDLEKAYQDLNEIGSMAHSKSKSVIVYISMAFGNPYGDPYHDEIILEHMQRLVNSGFRNFSMADTVGLATPDRVSGVMKLVYNSFPDSEIGIHLHCNAENWYEKVDAAYQAGCRMFDSAIGGFGGCPMAADDLIGNLSTESLIQYLSDHNVKSRINETDFIKARSKSNQIFKNIPKIV
ncbi:MAG: hydroxymethylglutaryl-CoA lyase [Bacteroidota bacterium]